jgi:hypothetical protein
MGLCDRVVTPHDHDGGMVTDEVVPLSGFGRLARTLGDEARRSGLAVPGFRSPPRLPGATRTIRRAVAGAPVVAVAVQGRPAEEVIGDMIDGIVAANGLRGVQAEEARLALSRTVAATEQRAIKR